MTDRVRRTAFSLPLERPLSTAHGDIGERRGFLVGVGGDGVAGLGEATPLPGWTESHDDCAAALASLPADEPSRSATPAARHGYRLARLDETARERAVPLAALLAPDDTASHADSVPVNATLGDDDRDATVAAAREAVAAGYDCLKLKVGARELEADLDRVRAVRDAVDATVRVDANGAWDLATAREAVDGFADLGVEYVEQPVASDALEALASLRGRGVDVAVDESLRRNEVEAVLAAGAADVAVLKPMALGGPDVAVDAARRLQAAGVDPVVTTTVDGAVARAAAVHVAATVPDVRHCGLATADLLAADLGPDPVPVSDGRIQVPEGPGNLGGRFDQLVEQ